MCKGNTKGVIVILNEQKVFFMKIDILGVKIDDVTMDEALKKVYNWLALQGLALQEEKHFIVTPNPEFIVDAQNNPGFKKILNSADLSIPDGMGLKLSGKIKNTTPGVDLMEKLVEMSAKRGFSVAFLGGRNQTAEKTAECLKIKYPKLKVTFAESGGEVDREGRLPPRNFPPTDILFVAFGHPKQEYWIAQNLPHIPVKVAMGVGGSLDYLSGIVPRATYFLRSLGLEWLFRLTNQPWRIKRQLKLFKYLFLLLTKR